MSKAKSLLLRAADKIILRIPEAHRAKFCIEVVKDNYSKLAAASVTLFVFEALLYFIQEAFFHGGYVILIFLMSNLVLIPLIWIMRKRIRKSTLPLALVLQYVYCLTIIALGLMLALVIQSRYDLIHMYLMAVIGVTAFVSMKPLRCLILLTIVYIAFWFLLPVFQTDTTIILTYRINAFVFNALAMFINSALIKAKYAAYLNRKSMEEKSTMLEDLARKDSMTGLLNHEESFNALSEQMRRASSYGTALSLILIDIDDFKIINDQFGHLSGDEIIRKVAACIRNTARDTDIVGRYGGEEFIIILPGVSLDGANSLAARFSSAIQAIDFLDARITISGGISQFQGETPEALIHLTDNRLYKAKNSGKNRFKCSDVPPCRC